MARLFRVHVFAESGQRITSETIEADASDTAHHTMQERYPTATRFMATAIKGPPCGHSRCSQYFIKTGWIDCLDEDLSCSECYAMPGEAHLPDCTIDAQRRRDAQ